MVIIKIFYGRAVGPSCIGREKSVLWNTIAEPEMINKVTLYTESTHTGNKLALTSS